VKNIFLVILFLVSLAGCATFQPKDGMTYQEFRQMSIKSIKGEPKLVKKVGAYEIYQIPSTNRDLAPTNAIAKALYDPNKDYGYVFVGGKLVDTILVNQIQNYSPPGTDIAIQKTQVAVAQTSGITAPKVNWTRIGVLPNKMMMYFSLEGPNPPNKNDIVKIKVLLDSKIPFGTSENSPTFLSSIGNYEVDCKGEKFRQVSLVGYPSTGGRGEGTLENKADSSWRTPAKGSQSQDIFDYVCTPEVREKVKDVEKMVQSQINFVQKAKNLCGDAVSNKFESKSTEKYTDALIEKRVSYNVNGPYSPGKYGQNMFYGIYVWITTYKNGQQQAGTREVRVDCVFSPEKQKILGIEYRND
jgi:hypothetical protein